MRWVLKVYMRVLGLLGPHWPAAGLCAANVALVWTGFVEPVLFGHVIGGLAGAGPSTASILAWATLDVLGVGAGMAASLVADRLTHRLRLKVMGHAFAHVRQRPVNNLEAPRAPSGRGPSAASALHSP